MSIEKIRKTRIMILACVFGMVIIQLAAPIILGVLVQGMALVVPLAVYHFFVKEKWRLKLVLGNGEAQGERQEKSEYPYEYDPGFRNVNPDGRETPFDPVKDLDEEMQETVPETETSGQQPGMRKWERIRLWRLP